MRRSASEIVNDLENRVAQLEKDSARKPKSIASTISELSTALRSPIDKVDPKLFARLSRDPRISKELQSAFRNYHKIHEKLKSMKSVIWGQGKLELRELMDSGYASEINRIASICKEVLSKVKIEFKGKRASMYPYLDFQMGRGSYALEVKFRIGSFESNTWGRPGTFMARGTMISLLSEEESEDLEQIIRDEVTKAIDAALPGFSALSGPHRLSYGGYGGASWVVTKETIIEYLETL